MFLGRRLILAVTIGLVLHFDSTLLNYTAQGVFVIVQLLSFLYITLVRPHKKMIFNLIEIIHESLLLMITITAVGLQSSQNWAPSIVNIGQVLLLLSFALTLILQTCQFGIDFYLMIKNRVICRKLKGLKEFLSCPKTENETEKEEDFHDIEEHEGESVEGEGKEETQRSTKNTDSELVHTSKSEDDIKIKIIFGKLDKVFQVQRILKEKA